VAEQQLYLSHISARFQQVRGKGMSPMSCTT
jgi:hypothetical protein